MKVEDVIIIGGGPAGISCAVQLTRYGIKSIIFEKENLGGLLVNANLVENYPGFPKGISGLELTKLLKEQIKEQKIKVFFEDVLNLTLSKECLKITTNKNSFNSRFAVVASGTRPKKFEDCVIPDKLNPKIFYEVYPLRDLRNKRVAIVGAGDAAFDYALSLKKQNEVVILNRKETTNCIPILLERVKKTANINYKKNIQIQKIEPSGHAIMLECIAPKGRISIEADYLLFAIGREPCLDFLSPEIENDRIYLAGDVKNNIFRQTAIATGDGIKTAMEIYNKIKEDMK
jgi:thioredoxin reductase (NADPH)